MCAKQSVSKPSAESSRYMARTSGYQAAFTVVVTELAAFFFGLEITHRSTFNSSKSVLRSVKQNVSSVFCMCFVPVIRKPKPRWQRLHRASNTTLQNGFRVETDCTASRDRQRNKHHAPTPKLASRILPLREVPLSKSATALDLHAQSKLPTTASTSQLALNRLKSRMGLLSQSLHTTRCTRAGSEAEDATRHRLSRTSKL